MSPTNSSTEHLAPIVIFSYNRVENLKKLLESLIINPVFTKSTLYIFIDGALNNTDQIKVDQVIEYTKYLKERFSNLNYYISAQNKGLAFSIIEGVTSIIQLHGKIIVLEDDLVCTPNFLSYMNQALNIYERDDRIFSICGYGTKIKKPKYYNGDVYLLGRSSSWGWGTWANRWEQVDWKVKDWDFIDKKTKKGFNRNGSDMYSMLKAYINKKNNSWAIRFCYTQFKLNKYSIIPFLSKIDNNGFGEDATHCKQSYSRFKVTLDDTNQIEFSLPIDILPNESIRRSCYKYHNIPIRIYSKVRNKLSFLIR